MRCFFTERPSEALPSEPSARGCARRSKVPYEPQTDSAPAQTSENLLSTSLTHPQDLHPLLLLLLLSQKLMVRTLEIIDPVINPSQGMKAKEIQALKAQLTKLKKQAKPVIKHHKAYLKSVSLKQRFPRKSFSKKHRVHKESVSKQGRMFAKGESSVQRDQLFDGMPEDIVDHMETENAQDEGRTREIVDEDKEINEVNRLTGGGDHSVSTDGSKVSTDRQIEGTEEQVKGTDELKEGTEEHNESTEEQREGIEEKIESTDGQVKGTEDKTEEEMATQPTQTSTQTPTSKIFGDDETIAKVLLNMRPSQSSCLEKMRKSGERILKTKVRMKSRRGVNHLKGGMNMIARVELHGRTKPDKGEELIYKRCLDDMKARILSRSVLLAELKTSEQEREAIYNRQK
ncbi:hypothetical protein Tco_0358884 [Tanacetum coccineum]